MILHAPGVVLILHQSVASCPNFLVLVKADSDSGNTLEGLDAHSMTMTIIEYRRGYRARARSQTPLGDSQRFEVYLRKKTTTNPTKTNG